MPSRSASAPSRRSRPVLAAKVERGKDPGSPNSQALFGRPRTQHPRWLAASQNGCDFRDGALALERRRRTGWVDELPQAVQVLAGIPGRVVLELRVDAEARPDLDLARPHPRHESIEWTHGRPA